MSCFIIFINNKKREFEVRVTVILTEKVNSTENFFLGSYIVFYRW